MRAERRRAQCGFTLVEMVLVIVLIAALVGVSAVFIVGPFRAAEDVERRAELVDAADVALNRMVREVRSALPNSVRVHQPSGDAHVEFITTRTGGRYRRYPAPGGGGDTFVPARSSDSFDVLGGLLEAGNVVAGAAGRNCANGTRDCLVVYNTGQDGFDAYREQNIAAITAVSATALTYNTGGTGPGFPAHSPMQRFYLVNGVVSYVCDLAAGELRRYRDYGLAHPAPDLGGVTSRLVASNVADCEFTYNPGTAERRGLLTLRLDLEKGGERIFLLSQAQVMNTP